MRRLLVTYLALCVLAWGALNALPQRHALAGFPTLLGVGAPPVSGGCAAVLALDGSTHVPNGSASGTLTTTNAADLLFSIMTINSGTVTGVTDTSGVTSAWALVTGGQSNSSGNDFELWWTKTTGALTGATITVSNSGATFTTFDFVAVSGANTSSPFDGSAINGTSDPLSITTTNANDMILGGFGTGVASPTSGATYNQISGADFQISEDKVVSSTNTYSFTIGTGVGTANRGVVAAVKRSC